MGAWPTDIWPGYLPNSEKARALAQRAEKAMAQGVPLVIDAREEIRAVRAFAEHEYGFWKVKEA